MAATDLIIEGSGPKKVVPKRGTTKACGHPGCKVVLRYTLEGWKHGVRNWTYDHEPVPAKGTPS